VPRLWRMRRISSNLMDFNTPLRSYQDGTIFNADLATLRAYLHAVNQQLIYDSRYKGMADVIQSLINERQNQERHQLASQQAKDLHQEAQLAVSKVSGGIIEVRGEVGEVKKEITEVKREVIEIKGTLKKTHRIHSWILFVAIVTAILAGIAAWEVIEKWFPNKPSAAVSEPIQPTPPHSTNK